MISREIELLDFHPDHWLHLLRGPGGDAQAGQGAGDRSRPQDPRGWLILIHQRDRIVHAALRGRRLPELIDQPAPAELAPLRERYRARRVVCLERNFLRRALSRGDGHLRYEQDYVEQLLILLRAFRAERGHGIRLEPPTPPGPVPPYDLLQFAFDRLWPDDTAVVLYVIDETYDQIWTSLILRKRRGDVDLATTDLFFGAEGLAPARWRDDRERLLGLVGERVARPHLGLFVSLPAWRKWLAAPLGSDTFVRLRAGRDLILDPFPRRLAWPAGLLRGASAWLRWLHKRR